MLYRDKILRFTMWLCVICIHWNLLLADTQTLFILSRSNQAIKVFFLSTSWSNYIRFKIIIFVYIRGNYYCLPEVEQIHQSIPLGLGDIHRQSRLVVHGHRILDFRNSADDHRTDCSQGCSLDCDRAGCCIHRRAMGIRVVRYLGIPLKIKYKKKFICLQNDRQIFLFESHV